MNAYILLFIAVVAIASVWLQEPMRWQIAALAVGLLVCTGWLFGVLAPVAILWLIPLFAAAWWAASERRGKMLAWVVFVTCALGLGFGLFPGFSHVVFTEAAPIKPGSVPYSLQFGLAKPLAAVAMLLWLIPVARGWTAWRASLRAALPVAGACVVAVPLLAWGMGYVHPQLELPPLHITMTWMVINLLLVCTAEEAFFRGLIQRGLARVVRPGFAIGVAALLFGLAHFAGGWLYVLLATVAGLGYGLAYHRAGQRIEAAIAAHFGVNLTQFLLFTYPAG